MARLNLLSVLFMDFVNKYTEIGEHKNTFFALETKIIL